MTIVPAYGRDYKNMKDVLKDFNSGKDFLVKDYKRSGYTSKKELIKMGEPYVEIRYSKLRKVMVVDLLVH